MPAIRKQAGEPITTRLSEQLPEQTDAGLRKSLAVLQVCSEAPKDLLEYRQTSFTRPSTVEMAVKALAEADRLEALQSDLSQLFYLEEKVHTDRLATAMQTLREGDAWYRLFQGSWRRARKFYTGLARNKAKRTAAECLEQLTTLSHFLLDSDRYEGNSEFKEAFGTLYKGSAIAQAFLGAAEGEMVKLELESRPTKQFKLLKIERAAESTTSS